MHKPLFRSLIFILSLGCISWSFNSDVIAHDLPPQRWESPIVASCFHQEHANHLPTVRRKKSKCPFRVTGQTAELQYSIELLSKQLGTLDHFASRALATGQLLDRLGTAWASWEKAEILQATASWQAKDYCPFGAEEPEHSYATTAPANRDLRHPYDLCIRDSRFGHFSYRGLSRIAHRQILVNQLAKLGRHDQRAEIQTAAELDLETAPARQCPLRDPCLMAYAAGYMASISEVFQGEAWRDLAGWLTQRNDSAIAMLQPLQSRYASAWATWNSPTIHRESFPMFVIYHFDGERLIVPAQNAKNFVRSNDTQTNSSSSIRASLAAARDYATTASSNLCESSRQWSVDRLRDAGLALLRLADTIEKPEESKVARGDQAAEPIR